MTNKNLSIPSPDFFDRVANAMLGFPPSFPGELKHAFDTTSDKYPPYNLIRVSSEKYRLVMAVAGFSKENINVTVKGNSLVISGTNVENYQNDEKYIHRGIATRNFTRSFYLHDNTKVDEVTMKDGLLTIDVVYEIPEEQKPKVIEIK